MQTTDFIQLFLFFALLIGLTPILGKYMAKVLTGDPHFLLPILGKIEQLIYKLCGIDPNQEMNWKKYTIALLVFNLVGFLFLFALLLTQQWLPLNPQHQGGFSWHLAFNSAISFVSNTNWQSYAGETNASNLTQMLGFGVQNFVSAATGIAVFGALVRGITGKTTDKIGNFWTDMVRSCLYILLPLAIVLSLLLVGQGVVQNFHDYTHITTMQGATQIIPQGPAASQIAIKQLGTNGGGFFNTNSAHPFENPTPFSNFLELLSILLIPASLTFTYGKMVKSNKHGWAVFSAMIILFAVGLSISLHSEFANTDVWHHMSNMEGKETRFGVTNSVLWSTATTAASNGSVNAMHDSLTPLSGMVCMINMMVGEVVFGGVGTGLYGMVIFIILNVFIAGLMVGRSPEFLGKKIEAFEIKMSMVAVLVPALIILSFSALACCTDIGLSGLANKGPHGFSEILYAFSSAAGNNGSSFAGLNVNTPFYNVLLALGMFVGRFGIIIPVLAIAGNMAKKKITPESAGTFRTDNWLFVGLLIIIILIVGGLTFFPALSVGPIVEHFLLKQGILF